LTTTLEQSVRDLIGSINDNASAYREDIESFRQKYIDLIRINRALTEEVQGLRAQVSRSMISDFILSLTAPGACSSVQDLKQKVEERRRTIPGRVCVFVESIKGESLVADVDECTYIISDSLRLFTNDSQRVLIDIRASDVTVTGGRYEYEAYSDVRGHNVAVSSSGDGCVVMNAVIVNANIKSRGLSGVRESNIVHLRR